MDVKLLKHTVKRPSLDAFPDEGDDHDFYLDLFDISSGEQLPGRDTRTRISIIKGGGAK